MLGKDTADKRIEIGQEKAQSVIDSITSSYAAEGQAVPNPAMVPPGAFPPPFGLPGKFDTDVHNRFVERDQGIIC